MLLFQASWSIRWNLDISRFLRVLQRYYYHHYHYDYYHHYLCFCYYHYYSCSYCHHHCCVHPRISTPISPLFGHPCFQQTRQHSLKFCSKYLRSDSSVV